MTNPAATTERIDAATLAALPPSELFGAAEAAKRLGCCYATVVRAIRSRRLPAVWRRRQWWTSAAAVQQLQIDDTNAAIDGRPAVVIPPTPAARSKSHLAAVKKLQARGLL